MSSFQLHKAGMRPDFLGKIVEVHPVEAPGRYFYKDKEDRPLQHVLEQEIFTDFKVKFDTWLNLVAIYLTP